MSLTKRPFISAGLTLLTASMLASCSPSETGSTTTLTGETTTTSVPATTEQTGTTVSTTTIATPTTFPTTTAAPTTSLADDTNQLASGSGCTPGTQQLPDGEWFGFVDELGEESLLFDLACWFAGEAAVRASAEDGEESPPPNDYYVRNGNDLTRQLDVDAGVSVEYYPDGDPANYFITDFENWGQLAENRGFFLGVWVTIEEGEVTKIVEQWVP